MAYQFDLATRLPQMRAKAAREFAAHVNPAHARLISRLGFDRNYVRGEGQYLWDAEERRVLDCLAGYGAIAIGRNHPAVVDALKQCLDAGLPSWVHFELNPLMAEAARMLKARCGNGLDRVYFCNSGAEGVETAIKLARRHTGRAGILAWTDCFHGLTCGALALNGSAELQKGFEPLLPGAALVPVGDLDALERALSAGTIAAFLVEPVQGKTLHALPPGQLAQVHALCKRHGTLLVADEVQTGAGRTGAFLACHHDGVVPDIVVLSKALSGGLVPVGAVLARGDVWDSTFSSMDRAIVHSTTFQGGALAMVALIATLEVIEHEKLVPRSAQLGQALLQQLQDACGASPAVRQVRGVGCMVGVELDPAQVPQLSAIPLIGEWTKPLVGQAATMSLLNRHSILAQTTGARRPLVKFMPPLTIADDDVRAIAAAMGQVAHELHSGSFYRALGAVAANAVRAAVTSRV